MLSQQEIKVLLQFLARVQIQGNEATTLVLVAQKLEKMLKPEEIKPKEVKEDK